MPDTKMTKSAGEHWVCSVLARLDWGPALTRDGLERTDILAVRSTETRRMVEIQVKAASAQHRSESTNWPINAKAQQFALSEREWFVFVMLPISGWQAPRSFVVPRDHVSAAAWIIHKDWRTDPSVAAGKRNAEVDAARVKLATWLGYEDRWDLLDNSGVRCPSAAATATARPCARATGGPAAESPVDRAPAQLVSGHFTSCQNGPTGRTLPLYRDRPRPSSPPVPATRPGPPGEVPGLGTGLERRKRPRP